MNDYINFLLFNILNLIIFILFETFFFDKILIISKIVINYRLSYD